MCTKKQRQTTTSSSSSSSKTKTTSSTTKSSTSEKTVSQWTGGQGTSVVISEVHSNIGSVDDGTLKGLQTQYVVTQPENVQQSQKPKEHYIFGGTQIVELGTTLGGEQFAREKNQSTWNGKFVYEGAPERTVTKTWTKQSTSTDPSTSTITTTTTTEEFVKSGTGAGSNVKTDVSTESSKLISDAMKKQTDSKLKSEKFIDSRSGTDVTDKADATDSLLESERCIAKKAYVTTNKDEQNVSSSSTSNIESQILSNKSLFDTTKTSTIKTDSKIDSKTNTRSDSKYDVKNSDRYPISTMPSRSSNTHDTNITSSSLVKASDASNHNSTEQHSQSFSTSSRTERASSSNQVIEIVDGKERIVSDTYNESGSQQSKSSQEKYKAKHGTGITPEVEYDQKTAEENIKFSTDKRDKVPIFDRDYHDSHRHIKQIGDNAPVEHLKGSYETTRYDDKTKKYVTDSRHHENNRLLDHTSRTTDSIQSKYDIEKTHLNNLSNNKLTHDSTTSTFDSSTKTLRDSNIKTTYDSNTSFGKKTSFDTKSYFDTTSKSLFDSNTKTVYDANNKFDSNINDRTTKTYLDNVSPSTKDFIRTEKSDSIDTKSTTYTTKVFDNKTNTWKVVDESSTNEMNKRSTTHKPSDIDRRSPTKYIDSTYTSETNKSHDKNAAATTTSSSNTITDIGNTNTFKSTDRSKILDDKRTSSIDKVSRTTDTKSMTKTSNEKVTQHLYDEKTKTWREVDEKTIKSKRPSLIRYVSQDNQGKFTTIYKRKLFDKRSGTWKVVDEKIYRNNNFNEHIPEVIEDVTNVTTTTYTTKVFDTKTNTWRVVDEQTFTDRNTTVPKDIADEIARDQPDIANITTTTELTKVMLPFLSLFHSLSLLC